MWLDIILIIVAVVLFINNMSLRSGLKWSKEPIELRKSANSKLVANLENANLKIIVCQQDAFAPIGKPEKRCLHLYIPKRKKPQSFPPIRRGILWGFSMPHS